jgi:hypothetical protein
MHGHMVSGTGFLSPQHSDSDKKTVPETPVTLRSLFPAGPIDKR